MGDHIFVIGKGPRRTRICPGAPHPLQKISKNIKKIQLPFFLNTYIIRRGGEGIVHSPGGMIVQTKGKFGLDTFEYVGVLWGMMEGDMKKDSWVEKIKMSDAAKFKPGVVEKIVEDWEKGREKAE